MSVKTLVERCARVFGIANTVAKPSPFYREIAHQEAQEYMAQGISKAEAWKKVGDSILEYLDFPEVERARKAYAYAHMGTTEGDRLAQYYRSISR
jgi:hypothetical protein